MAKHVPCNYNIPPVSDLFRNAKKCQNEEYLVDKK